MEEGFGLRMRRRRVWKSIQACFCIFTKYIGWEAGAEREREMRTNLSWRRPRVDDGWHTALSPVRQMVVTVTVTVTVTVIRHL